MAARIHFNHASQTLFYGSMIFGYFGRDGQPRSQIIRLGDPFMQLFRKHRWILPIGPASIGTIFGFDGFDSYDETYKVSSKPQTVSDTDRYDWDTYGSIYRGFQILDSALTGKVYSIPSHSSESSMRHFDYTGEFIALQESVPVYPGVWDLYDDRTYYHEIPHWNGLSYYSGWVSSTNPLSMTLISNYWEWDILNLSTLIKWFNTLDKVERVEGTWRGTLTSFSSSYIPSYLSCKYHVVAYEINAHTTNSWDAEVLFPLELSTIQGLSPIIGQTYWTPRMEPCIYKCNNFIASGSPLPDTTLVGDFGWLEDGYNNATQPMAVMLTKPSTSMISEQTRCFNGFSRLSDNYFLNSFEKAVSKSWNDIVPSSLFSTVDAFKQAEGSLDANLLQNLQKIPAIADALPHVGEAIRILGKILKRDLRLSTLKEILDLATSTVLQANFEWRPYLAIITEYLPELISTWNSLGDITKNSIGRGSYRFQINNDLGRESVTLLTRTKIVMDASASGLLSASLNLDALGLLPKPSNLWDLMPFSFIANWFTGVGGAIRRMEYSLFLASIPSYFVHTYTLTSPLSADELAKLDLASSSVEAPSLRLYYRDISLYNPYPRDSRFGFGIPRELPPMGTLGCLLYQLIFG